MAKSLGALVYESSYMAAAIQVKLIRVSRGLALPAPRRADSLLSSAWKHAVAVGGLSEGRDNLRTRMSSSLLRGSVSLAFLLSGLAGLIYEVVWAKYLTLFIGGTALAHTIVLATFMGGLACGNAVFGRLADRTRMDRLRLYALLEVGIGLFCILFPAVFGWLADVYVALGTRTGPTSPLNPLFKAALAAASLFIPCTLMGGTLPVLTKFVVDSLAGLGVRLAWLYFVNTAGAVGGCLLGGFYVVERWGLDFGMVGTSLVNFAIGGLFYLLSRGRRWTVVAAGDSPAGSDPTSNGGEVAATRSHEPDGYNPGQVRTAFWCIATAGGLSMLYELVWFRLLVLSIGGTVHSFSIMLTGFIAGIAFGSSLAAWVLRRRRNALALFGLCELGIALASLVPFALFETLPFAFFRIGSRLVHAPETYGLYLVCAVVFGGVLMGVPAVLMGAALPLASRVCVARLEAVGRVVGDVFSANTLGNVVGALITGLVLLPRLGLERTLLLGGCLSGLLGVILLRSWRPSGVGSPVQALRDAVRVASSPAGPRIWPAALLLVLGLGALRWAFSPQWDPRILQSGLYRWERKFETPSWQAFQRNRSRVKVLYARDGADASLLVEDFPLDPMGPAGPTQWERVVRVNGKPDATTGGDLPTQLFIAHLGLFLHPDPKRVMVVGLGSGATAAAVLRHPGVRADVAEISPEMVEAAAHFDAINDGVLRNPRMSLAVLDAREFLLLTRKTYDVIVSEPTNIWIPGVSMLFTQDFYELVLRRLEPDGLFTQWLHAYAIDGKVVASAVASLQRVFPYVSVWAVGDGDLIFLAGRSRPQFDPERFARRFEEVGPARGLSSPNVQLGLLGDPVLFLLNQVATHEALLLHWPTARAQPYRDLFPRMEFAAARAQFLGRPYLLLAELDERLGRVGSEPLFLEEYLSRFPLGEKERDLLEALSRFSLPYKRLRNALVLHLILEGSRETSLLLSLPEDLAGKTLLARELARELDDSHARPLPEACSAYLNAEGAVLAAATSIFGRPHTESLEKRIDACIGAHPARADELGSRLVVILASAGASDRALERFNALVAAGTLERLHPRDRAALLVEVAKLFSRVGRRSEALRAVVGALAADPVHAEGLRLFLAFQGESPRT